MLEDLTGGFNYGSGTVELELPPRSRGRTPLAGQRLHWLRCRIDRHDAPAARTGATYSHRPEIYSITAAPVGAPPARHARRAASRRDARRHATARPARCSRCATRRCSSSGRRDARGPGPRDRRLGALGAARGLRRLDRVRPPLRARPRLGRDRARPGDPRDRAAAGSQYGAVPPKGAVLRFTRYRHGGGRAGNVDRRHADACSRARSPGIDTVTNPDPAIGGVDAEQHRPTRASARRWRSASRYRAVTAEDFEFLAGEATPARRARGLHPAARRRRRCRCTSSRASTRPTACCTTTSWCPTRRCCSRGRRVPRRAPADRHDGPAAAVPLPRPVGGRQPAGLAARRHRARRGGRRARALHVPEPAGRRQRRTGRAAAGRSGARSTRASCTASSTPSTASSS